MAAVTIVDTVTSLSPHVYVQEPCFVVLFNSNIMSDLDFFFLVENLGHFPSYRNRASSDLK